MLSKDVVETDLRSECGGAFTRMARIPQSRNSQTTSDFRQAVVVAMAAKSRQRACPPYPAEIHRKLGRQWPGRELGECQTFDIVILQDPTALFDQILLHVCGKRNRPAEAQRSKFEEIRRQSPQAGVSQAGRLVFAHTHRRPARKMRRFPPAPARDEPLRAGKSLNERCNASNRTTPRSSNSWSSA